MVWCAYPWYHISDEHSDIIIKATPFSMITYLHLIYLSFGINYEYYTVINASSVTRFQGEMVLSPNRQGCTVPVCGSIMRFDSIILPRSRVFGLKRKTHYFQVHGCLVLSGRRVPSPYSRCLFATLPPLANFDPSHVVNVHGQEVQVRCQENFTRLARSVI